MTPIQTAITGQENAGDLTTPYEALIQFYCAFNNGDMDMMSKNWAQSDEIAMDNPLGGIKRGWTEIQPVYERIFNGQAKVYVEYFDYTLHETAEMFYAVGRERGYCHLGDEEIPLAIRTSRIFQKLNGYWQQVHHHGSIEDPLLLKRYQSAVLRKHDQNSLLLEPPILTGSCLCGHITYEIHGQLTQALNCHCSMCRKAQGSAFRSRAQVNSNDFKLTKGQELITYFESSPGNHRGFCKKCGSPINSKFDQHPEVLGLPLGSLNNDPGIKPELHVFVGSKAPWYEITDALPQHDELPTS
jgi:hypothetical protein